MACTVNAKNPKTSTTRQLPWLAKNKSIPNSYAAEDVGFSNSYIIVNVGVTAVGLIMCEIRQLQMFFSACTNYSPTKFDYTVSNKQIVY